MLSFDFTAQDPWSSTESQIRMSHAAIRYFSPIHVYQTAVFVQKCLNILISEPQPRASSGRELIRATVPRA